MTAREASFDHAAEARKHIDWVHEWQSYEGDTPEANLANAGIAQAHATLALVEQQRIANLIAYVTHSDGLPDGHKEWLEQEMGL